MDTKIKTDQETVTLALAEAIVSFDIIKVADLLKDDGEFCVQDEKNEIVPTNKVNFLNCLERCFDAYLSVNEETTRLNYSIDRCLYCKIGNPVLIFENGRFPVFTRELWEKEKCGLMLEFRDNLFSDISFCFMFAKLIILIYLRENVEDIKINKYKLISS
jgi:hypothetical protein